MTTVLPLVGYVYAVPRVLPIFIETFFKRLLRLNYNTLTFIFCLKLNTCNTFLIKAIDRNYLTSNYQEATYLIVFDIFGFFMSVCI